MKTIISQDLKSWITPTPGQLLKVASDGEGFEWIADLSHGHSNKAILDQIAANPIETITAGSNIMLNRVGNSLTIASAWGGGGGGFWVDPDANNLISVNNDFLFADKRSSAHAYDNTLSTITSTNVQWAIDELSASIDTAESTLQSIDLLVQTNTEDISENTTSITSINTNITNINSDITNINSDIASINTAITTQASDIASINTSLDGIWTSITTINSVNATQTSDIATINTNITGINSSITTINNSITTLNARMPSSEGVLLVDGWQTSVTTTTHTLTLANYNTTIVHTNASDSTITVPPNSSVAFPINTQIDIVQNWAGKVTLAQWAGVTINSKWWNKSLAAQYTWATLKKVWTDTWILFGELIA